MATYTITATETTLINVGGQGVSPDGLALQFTVSGTNSAVLKRLTSPPGAAQSFTNVAYLNASLASQSAGTAVTASGMAYISAADAAQDLYVTNTYTSGSVVITSSPWSIGGSGGGGGSTVPAADVTAGTFGANTGETGAYAAPGALSSGTTLGAGTSVSFTTLSASTTALATPSALAATASNQFASTVSGATLMGFGTTHDVTLKNRAGTSVLGVTANTSDVTAAGALAVTGVLSNAATSASLAQSATTAQLNVGAGTQSGAAELRVRSAAGQSAAFSVNTASAARWAFLKGTTSEAGANAGSELQIRAFDDAGTGIDSPITIIRAAAGAIYTSSGRQMALGGAPGDATTATRMTKAVTAIADNTATTVLTITVPNGQVSATVKLTAIGVLGAGGAIGAGEANASNSYDITIVRTAGVNAVADISTAYGVNAANVAGADTCTAAITVAAVSGAVGATNTFPVQITIIKSGGASANHTCVLRAEVINQSASGCTVA